MSDTVGKVVLAGRLIGEIETAAHVANTHLLDTLGKLTVSLEGVRKAQTALVQMLKNLAQLNGL